MKALLLFALRNISTSTEEKVVPEAEVSPPPPPAPGEWNKAHWKEESELYLFAFPNLKLKS